MLRKLPSTLKMDKLIVPQDYIENFFKADNTFLYQLVFDPIKRKLVPLNPYPPDLDPTELHYAGPYPFACTVSELNVRATILSIFSGGVERGVGIELRAVPVKKVGGGLQ